jgi:hypothetical protein
MADAALTNGETRFSKAGCSTAIGPEKDEGGTSEDHLEAALRTIQELKLQLVESQACAGSLKLERDDLRELLNKAVAKKRLANGFQ